MGSVKVVICCWMGSAVKPIVYLITIAHLVLIQPVEGAIESKAIFGVRWFLGERFRLQPPLPIRKDEGVGSHLMLIFNTHSSYDHLNFSVQAGTTRFSCGKVRVEQKITSDHHGNFNEIASQKGDAFVTYIHKCPLTFSSNSILENTPVLPYAILAQDTQHKEEILYQSVLRSPAFAEEELSLAVLGDWGLMTNFSKQLALSQPITDCLHLQIDQNHNLRLLLLLGDLAYDLEGHSYVAFLTYLSGFSSQIVILLTPGNHESIRHEDVYQLFKESFYSPSWGRFFGYFDLVSIRNHLFLGYSSEHLFPWLNRTSQSSLFQIALKEEYSNFPNLFAQQFTAETRTAMKQKTVIAFSHYPTYCSKQDDEEDCDKYKQLQQPFTRELQDLGVDIFLAGHVHMYERTKQICKGTDRYQSGHLINKDISEFSSKEGCSVFVLQGVGGNNYFVESGQTLNLKKFSQKFVGNTGFGVLTLNSNIQNDTHFCHISVKEKCRAVDQFVLHANPQEMKAVQASLTLPFWISILIASLIIATVIVKRKALQRTLMRWKRRRSSIPTAAVQLTQQPNELIH